MYISYSSLLATVNIKASYMVVIYEPGCANKPGCFLIYHVNMCVYVCVSTLKNNNN